MLNVGFGDFEGGAEFEARDPVGGGDGVREKERAVGAADCGVVFVFRDGEGAVEVGLVGLEFDVCADGGGVV